VNRLRFRLRTLSILVAVLAFAIAGEQMRRRRAYCMSRAAFHRHMLLAWNGGHMQIPLYSPEVEERMAKRNPHAAWHLRVASAYTRAASQPWVGLPFEPPEPRHFLIPPDQDRP
jgi:hypothetical protein